MIKHKRNCYKPRGKKRKKKKLKLNLRQKPIIEQMQQPKQKRQKLSQDNQKCKRLGCKKNLYLVGCGL